MNSQYNSRKPIFGIKDPKKVTTVKVAKDQKSLWTNSNMISPGMPPDARIYTNDADKIKGELTALFDRGSAFGRPDEQQWQGNNTETNGPYGSNDEQQWQGNDTETYGPFGSRDEQQW